MAEGILEPRLLSKNPCRLGKVLAEVLLGVTLHDHALLLGHVPLERREDGDRPGLGGLPLLGFRLFDQNLVEPKVERGVTHAHDLDGSQPGKGTTHQPVLEPPGEVHLQQVTHLRRGQNAQSVVLVLPGRRGTERVDLAMVKDQIGTKEGAAHGKDVEPPTGGEIERLDP